MDLVFLFIYSIGKAFLPLPSLEVVLLPLYFHHPSSLLYYCMISSVGTMIGGSIGYFLSSLIKEDNIYIFVEKEKWEKMKKIFYKHKISSVFLGGFTPFPDFLMAYMAGFIHLPFFVFIMSDTLARLLRSMILLLTLDYFNILINLESVGWYLLIIVLVYYAFKYSLKYYRKR